MTYWLSLKGEAITKLNEFITLTKNIFSKQIKGIGTNNLREYLSNDFENYLKINGIEHQLSVPYCSPQNGVEDGKNCTLVKMARTMLLVSIYQSASGAKQF